MNEDWEGEELLNIDDPQLPEALRDHAKRIKNPGKVVIVIGDGEYLLYAADGEWLDLCLWTKSVCTPSSRAVEDSLLRFRSDK
jgi:hypothetical protein